MRKSGDWNVVWDDRILEVAREEGVVTIQLLDENEHIPKSKATISRRCSKLREHGLLREIGVGTYQITERGEGYLDGEYSAQTGMWSDDGAGDTGGTGDPDVSEMGNGL